MGSRYFVDVINAGEQSVSVAGGSDAELKLTEGSNTWTVRHNGSDSDLEFLYNNEERLMVAEDGSSVTQTADTGIDADFKVKVDSGQDASISLEEGTNKWKTTNNGTNNDLETSYNDDNTFVISSDGQLYNILKEKQKLIASDIEADDEFGFSVAISDDGNTAIIGARFEDTGGSNAGAAYIFTRSGGTWTEQQKIEASDAAGGDEFGYSVSLSGDGNTAIVGAKEENTGGSSAGAAYIFTRSGGTWTEQQKIQSSDIQAGDRFGQSVSISSDGNTAIVGVILEDTGASGAGAAYVFTRNGGTWTQQQKIQASDAEANDQFGRSVSISSDGNTAIVGANAEDTGGSDAGAAYIFTRTGGTWTEQQKIQSSDIEAGDEFGWSVSISSDGNMAIVGANQEDTGGSNAGAAYIFTRSSGTWTQQQKIQASDAAGGDEFGWSVSISGEGNTAVVGARLESAEAGAAYVFTRSGGTWTEQQKVVAGDAEAGDRLGQAVSLSGDGNTICIGAFVEDTGATAAGAVYIFSNDFASIGATESVDYYISLVAGSNRWDIAHDEPTGSLSISYNSAEAFAVSNGLFPVVPSYTVASLPTAESGGMIFVTDETGGAVLAFGDSTGSPAVWRRVTDRAIVS